MSLLHLRQKDIPWRREAFHPGVLSQDTYQTRTRPFPRRDGAGILRAGRCRDRRSLCHFCPNPQGYTQRGGGSCTGVDMPIILWELWEASLSIQDMFMRAVDLPVLRRAQVLPEADVEERPHNLKIWLSLWPAEGIRANLRDGPIPATQSICHNDAINHTQQEHFWHRGSAGAAMMPPPTQLSP